MAYYEMCDRKSEIEKEIESLWEQAEEEAVEHHGDIFEYRTQQEIEVLADEFLDKERLEELENEWEELNSAIGSYEDAHNIH